MTPQPLIAPPSAERPAPRLETPPCPLCGGDDPRPSRYRFAPHAVVRCRRCGLWYLAPRLAEDAMRQSYVDDSYFEGAGAGYSSYLAQEATLRHTFRRFLGELDRRGMTGGRLLEVGCAYGFFLDEAAGHFTARVGTEFSARAADRAEGRDHRILLGGLEQLAPDERFETAAAIHVIEHVYEPVTFLARLREHLVPGGWAVLATPDMGAFWRPLMGRRWTFFKIPEHVTYFDRSTLRRLFAAAGYRDVRTLPYASVFPLDLVAEKLGLAVPRALRHLRLRLPATTVAMAGRSPGPR